MALTPVRPQDIDEILLQQNGPLTKLYKVAAPNTTIVNRALVTDFSKDLLPKFGNNRIMVQSLQEVQGEAGASGERVFRALNDVHDQLRFVGSDWGNSLDSTGAHPSFGGVSGSYIEIVFYGTGINMITSFYATNWSATSLTYSVDGGSTSFVTTGSTYSAVTRGRNYPENSLLPIVSGLSLGLHSVKIALSSIVANGVIFGGFEVIGPTTLNLSPGTSYIGGRKLSKPTLTTDSFNSVFESGTLGTKGGHVVVYQKADGSVAKAVNPTDATTLTYPNAVHTNEDVTRQISPREFSAGRTDDFSVASASGSYNFTLDDDTTTLVASSAYMSGATGNDLLRHGNVANAFFSITFVGTGLDIIQQDDTAGGSDTYNFSVDNGTAISLPTAGVTTLRSVKLVSGLPYGTHTVKITRVAATTFSLGVLRFVVYGPKKPSIPAGAVELADYFLMGNFVANSAGSINPSTGTLRKSGLRELTYSGTWTVAGIDAGFSSGVNINTAVAGSYFEYTFFGTGFEHKTYFSTSIAYNMTYTVDGSTNLSAYTVAVYSANLGTVTANSSTGVVSGTSGAGAGSYGSTISITGLPLGLHKIRMTSNNTANIYSDCLDIVTPVHSPKSNAPGDLQNTQLVGSQAVGDSRKFALQSIKALSNWSEAFAVSSAPTTTSIAAVPMPDMACVIKTNGNPIEINFESIMQHSVSGANMIAQIYVDGVQVGPQSVVSSPGIGLNAHVVRSIITPVAAGTHLVQVFWNTSTGTLTAYSNNRTLRVKENT